MILSNKPGAKILDTFLKSCFRSVQNLNIDGEDHKKSLSNSDNKAKKTKKHQAIENLDVINSTSVYWNGIAFFHSISFCSPYEGGKLLKDHKNSRIPLKNSACSKIGVEIPSIFFSLMTSFTFSKASFITDSTAIIVALF